MCKNGTEVNYIVLLYACRTSYGSSDVGYIQTTQYQPALPSFCKLDNAPCVERCTPSFNLKEFVKTKPLNYNTGRRR